MSAERHNETLRPGIAVMVVIFNERKEILLGLRSSKVGMGTWALPGGKVDLQESTLQAAEREVSEETGLNIENPRFISVAYEEFYGLEYMTLGILATAKGEPVNRQSESIKDWEWFPLDNLPRPLFAPASRIIRNYKKGVMCSKDQFYNRGRTV